MSNDVEMISKRYDELGKRGCGAVFCKVDLHVHTPGSNDAQAKSKYNFSYEKRKNEVDVDQNVMKIIDDIIKACVEKGLSLIAITDHNSPGYLNRFDIGSRTWYSLIRQAIKESKIQLVVLPGCEISTDDAHVLAVLPPEESTERDAYSAYKIAFMLRACNFKVEDYGVLARTGSKSVLESVRMITDDGGIGIPAHIDGGKKAMLEHYKQPGIIYENILNEPGLNALEIVKEKVIKKKFGKYKMMQEYFDKIRKEPKFPVAFIQDSDGHSCKEIGQRFSYVKMEEPSFYSLKNALGDPEVRLRLEKELKLYTSKTFILGMCIEKDKKTQFIRFNENLNCIVGLLGTFKSTILKLLIDGMGRVKEEEREAFAYLEKLGYNVQVFVKQDIENAEVYCFAKKFNEKELTMYRLEKDGTWKLLSVAKLDLRLPRLFNSNLVKERFENSDALMEFLRRVCFVGTPREGEANKFQEGKNDLLKKIGEGGNSSLVTDLKKCLVSLSGMNKDMIKNFERIYSYRDGKPLLRLEIDDGVYSDETKLLGAIKSGEPVDDVPTIYLVKDKKKTKFDSLTSGEKNMVMMLILMSQDSFGPLVIDEPESYLDKEVISNFLVPRLRDVKASQQLIVVTVDSDIVVTGDSENVIITKSDKELGIDENGDIYKESIKNKVVNLLEGGRASIIKRDIKLNMFS